MKGQDVVQNVTTTIIEQLKVGVKPWQCSWDQSDSQFHIPANLKTKNIYGYSEVLVDSDGEHHGVGLGNLLSSESDFLKQKYQRRFKLRAIANKAKNARKRRNVYRNNLGRQKLERRARITAGNIRDVVFKSVHAVVDKAAVIAAEDLTAPMKGKSFGKNVNRRLASWTKGTIAEALDTVSQRRGSTLILVNAAYTSQMDHRHGLLMGRRVGDSFHCLDGVVFQADENAAKNVKARLCDPEIDRYSIPRGEVHFALPG